MPNLEAILPFANETQAEKIRARIEHGSNVAAGRALGCSEIQVRRAVRTVSERAARAGVAPGHFQNGVAPGYLMGKVTIERDHRNGGVVTKTWERQSPDRDAILQAMRDAAEAISEDMPRAPAIEAPNHVNADLCNLYTFSDFHLGMLAWHQEGGADWDIAIAERTLLGSFGAMVAQSPPAHTAVLNIQGDFLHTDGKLPLTPASKHVLDADSRFPKIRKAAIRLIRHLMSMALERHAEVHLIIAEGNHDEESSGWLADMMSVHYENDPRVTVNDSALPFYVFEWGATMLGVHHGHKVKNEQLPGLFSAQFRELYGRTRFTYIHCGHRHHVDEKEYNGAIVIQHPTIAARDAYAARGGWIADRAVQAITYHRRFGQVGRVFVTPEMIAA